MKLVLLSGGSGKRLWPLSNESRSKQFVKVLGGEGEENQSMLQRVWGQLSRVGLSSSTVIATGKAQTDTIMHQLNQRVPLIIEPARRDTFPAVALSAAYYYSQGVHKDEIITILPVDPYVEDRFFEHVRQLEDVLRTSGAQLALIGVKPTYPSAKYGYILPDDSANISGRYAPVRHFKEKPTEEDAQSYIEQQALWNCGVFAFRLGYLIAILQERGYPADYDELIRAYDALPKRSFDYEIIESAKDVVVHPYEGYWKDLGTWNTLTEEMSAAIKGKGKLSADSLNSHIVNELDIPITVLGLSNIVVAASPDGILVAEKSASPRIKEVMGEYEERPMYEERRWGWYRVLDYVKHDERHEALTKRICVLRNRNSSYQVHAKRDEVWTFIKGTGEVIIDNRHRVVRAGDVCHIPAGTPHAIRAETDLEFIEVQSGSVILEEDCERLLYEWQDILERCE